MMLYIIFDPQGRDDEVMRLQAHSLVINGHPQQIMPESKSIRNGLANLDYLLTATQLEAISNATTVGVVVRSTYNSPLFLGFEEMPFADGAQKLVGLLNMCSSVK
jgi:hypothetical protein